jgi:hypothetical protein
MLTAFVPLVHKLLTAFPGGDSLTILTTNSLTIYLSMQLTMQ